MDGIILCNKPKGITSNQIVRNISKKFNIKAGNTGILDYAAEGLLIIVIGKATRFTSFFQNLDKKYIAVGELGKETDTCDINGDIVKEAKVDIEKDMLIEIIKSFEGHYLMVPPKYSSKKINGKRAYRYALKGVEIELKPINVKINEINIIEINLPFFTIFVNCSSGTYIRSLIRDIGEKSNCFAYMYKLTRVSIGDFSISNSIEYEKLINLSYDEFYRLIIPISKALYFFPAFIIENFQIKNFKNGQKIKINQSEKIFKEEIIRKNNEGNFILSNLDDKLVKVIDINDNLIGLGILEEGFQIQPKIVLK
ncbi:MAG TPA: tRNA pseudouridine(55) synthase TruB [Exilispira sp.]|nr:tRNA pseudouridine(55) synthase TruB [Exilispira sp.]